MRYGVLIFMILFLASCGASRKKYSTSAAPTERMPKYTYHPSSSSVKSSPNEINTAQPERMDVNRKDLVRYARQFIGVPYKYGGNFPETGFDCSGFVCYVFRHYNMNVPRTSVSYTNLGKEVSIKKAKPGDIILFTTPSNNKKVGHMGIVLDNEKDKLTFLHAATSRSVGVMISELKGYFQDHFVKIISLLD